MDLDGYSDKDPECNVVWQAWDQIRDHFCTCIIEMFCSSFRAKKVKTKNERSLAERITFDSMYCELFWKQRV